MTLHDLPVVNASLNGLSAVFLLIGYVFMRQKKMTAHRNCMIAAFTTSVLFLACYLTYHFMVHTVTPFAGPPQYRPFYLALLLSHTILAVVLVPLFLLSLHCVLMAV